MAPVPWEPITEIHISPGRQEQQNNEQLPEPAKLQEVEPRTERIPQQATLQHDTCNQWLRWVGEQVSSVVNRIEEEEKAQRDRLFAATEELEKARTKIRSLEEV